jgi:hypothetical protein
VCKFAAVAPYFSDGGDFTMYLVRFNSPEYVEEVYFPDVGGIEKKTAFE